MGSRQSFLWKTYYFTIDEAERKATEACSACLALLQGGIAMAQAGAHPDADHFCGA